MDDWEATLDPFPTVAIQTFDSSLRDLLVSNDPVAIRAAIADLAASGGTGCSEASNEALVVMGRMLDKGSTALLLTDEPSDPYGPSKEEVASLYREKGIAIRTLLTGSCDGPIATETITTSTTETTTLQVAAIQAEAVLAPENPVATFSTLAAETGGSFLAINSFGEPYYKQSILDAANSPIKPTIALMTPWLWGYDSASNTILDVEITGANTNFNDTSMISFDIPDILVNSLTVESPRRIIANLTIQGGSSAKKMTVTTDLGGGEVEITGDVAFQNLRPIPVYVPTVATVAPTRAALGETRDVTVRGAMTNFVDGLSAVDFGPGITVNYLQVIDPLTVLANITVDSGAAVGLHAVTVTTGSEVATVKDISSFQITHPPAAIPRLAAVAPGLVLRGQTADLTITGLNTGFVDQTSFLDLVGDGVMVNSLTITSPTEATANVTVAADAPLGYLDAIMVTGGEDALLLDAFAVTQ